MEQTRSCCAAAWRVGSSSCQSERYACACCAVTMPCAVRLCRTAATVAQFGGGVGSLLNSPGGTAAGASALPAPAAASGCDHGAALGGIDVANTPWCGEDGCCKPDGTCTGMLPKAGSAGCGGAPVGASPAGSGTMSGKAQCRQHSQHTWTAPLICPVASRTGHAEGPGSWDRTRLAALIQHRMHDVQKP